MFLFFCERPEHTARRSVGLYCAAASEHAGHTATLRRLWRLLAGGFWLPQEIPITSWLTSCAAAAHGLVWLREVRRRLCEVLRVRRKPAVK